MNQKTQKQEILSRAKRLVKHRERMMKKFGATPNFDKVKKILTRIDFFGGKDLRSVCHLILNMKEDIKSILAGETSKFYKSDLQKAEELFELCNQNLNQ